MSELEQWCEIDGHEWVTFDMLHGFKGEGQIWYQQRTCQKCRTKEESTYFPSYEPKMSRVLYPPMVI